MQTIWFQRSIVAGDTLAVCGDTALGDLDVRETIALKEIIITYSLRYSFYDDIPYALEPAPAAC